MMPRSRDRVALIIAKMKGAKDSDRKPRRPSADYSEPGLGSGSEDSDGLQSAAEDIISAVESGSASDLVRALSDFLSIHSQECDEPSEDASSSLDEEAEE